MIRAIWIVILASVLGGCSVTTGRPPSQAPGTPLGAVAQTLADRLDDWAENEPLRLEHVKAQIEALNWAMDQAESLPLPNYASGIDSLNPDWLGEGSTLLEPDSPQQASTSLPNANGLTPLQPLGSLSANAEASPPAPTPLSSQDETPPPPTSLPTMAGDTMTQAGTQAGIFSALSQTKSVLYALHLASYRNLATTQEGWREVQAAHPALSRYHARIDQVNLAERGTFMRLKIGPFETREAALGTCTALRESGLYCALESYEGDPL